MGINYLRESISRSKRRNYERMKSSSRSYQAILKQRNYKSSPIVRRCSPYECVVGSLNGFQVTKMLQLQRARWKAEPKIVRPIECLAQTNPLRTPSDPQLRVIRVPKRYAQKRKVLSPDKRSGVESCDFDRVLLSKKIKMDTGRRSVTEPDNYPKQCPNKPQTMVAVSGDITPMKKREPDTTKSAPVDVNEDRVKNSRSSPPLISSPSSRKRLRTLPPEAHPEIPIAEARTRPTWRSNFLQKCAELVEVRFSNPIRLTYVKPFYAQFSTCWQESKEALQLETSNLPRHEELQVALNDPDGCSDAFSADETEILLRNFFQISKAYRLRHPYLIACIQTGLETRKEIYDFNKFRTANQIIEKLCVNIPDKTSRACIMQLRTLLTPQILPYSQFEVDKIVANLFAGFGPDWNTIAKLTGFNQVALKTTIALYHNIDLGFIPPQVWFEIHQRILEANESGSEIHGRFECLPKPSSPERTPRNVGEVTPCRIQRKRLTLPSFNSVFSPL